GVGLDGRVDVVVDGDQLLPELLGEADSAARPAPVGAFLRLMAAELVMADRLRGPAGGRHERTAAEGRQGRNRGDQDNGGGNEDTRYTIHRHDSALLMSARMS